MATKNVKKVAATGDIGGLSRTRYEKMETAYGVIQSTDYASGDILAFQIPSREIISAQIIAHAVSPVTLDVVPGTDISSALALDVGTSAVDISYVIHYLRGTGKPDGSTDQGQLLQLEVTIST